MHAISSHQSIYFRNKEIRSRSPKHGFLHAGIVDSKEKSERIRFGLHQAGFLNFCFGLPVEQESKVSLGEALPRLQWHTISGQTSEMRDFIDVVSQASVPQLKGKNSCHLYTSERIANIRSYIDFTYDIKGLSGMRETERLMRPAQNEGIV